MLNPAFCAEIMRLCFLGYTKEKKENFPFPLNYLILPLILHSEARKELPDRINVDLKKWVLNNDELVFLLYEKIVSMRPYTNESIFFLLNQDFIQLSNNGTIILTKLTEHKKTTDGDDYFEKGLFLGRWFSRYSTAEIYNYFKIKP